MLKMLQMLEIYCQRAGKIVNAKQNERNENGSNCRGHATWPKVTVASQSVCLFVCLPVCWPTRLPVHSISAPCES